VLVTVTAAVAACVILVALALFQIALIAGAPIGRFAWGGQHHVLPATLRVGSAISILLYAVFALILMQKAGLTTVFRSDVFVQSAAWVLVVYFTLGILMNGISRSKAERTTMVPVTAVLAILGLIVAIS
jgi:hypothetical protein